MRFLFTSVSAHGHLLPMAPLMQSALEAGHEVAVVVSADLGDVVRAELPAQVQFLPAGPMPFVLATEAARRTGDDVMQPSVAGIGETFGGVLLDLSVPDAVPAARAWAPDLVVADMYCTLGGYLAAALDVPWHRFVMSVALPPEWTAAIGSAAAERFDRAGLRPVPPTSTLDVWPPALARPEDDVADSPVVAVRTRAHTRDGGPGPEPLAPGTRPRVLVTLGTTFSDAASLRAVVASVRAADVDVVATRGMLLGENTSEPTSEEDAGVRWVGFTPIDELLEGVDAVVGVGGAGTVLAALSQGVPLVLWPQGADQPRIAERVADAGAGVVVDDLADLSGAVTTVLQAGSHRARAAQIAAQIAAADDLHDVVARLTPATARH